MNKRKTPLMGWSSWNAFRADITEDKIKKQVDLLNSLGLKDLGYEYVNIDDGFFGGRDENGQLKFRKDKFPNGLQSVNDYIHEAGLKAGIYSDGGDSTCASFFDKEGDNGKGVGLVNHEEEDLNLFFKDLGFDFIKVDWCGGQRLGLDEEEQYTKISNIIKEISRDLDKDLIFNICRWQFPGAWAQDVADSWRIAGDIVPEFDSVLYEIDSAKPFYNYHGPGHINDLDMLDLGNGMSYEEDKSHFAMWCMMSTPLILGCDLEKIEAETLGIIKNKDLIAINQDPACLQAYVIARDKAEDGTILTEVYLKDLGEKGSNEKALAFLNRSNEVANIKLDLKDAGLLGDILELRELTDGVDIEPMNHLSVTLKPHQTMVFRVKAQEGSSPENLDKQSDFKPFEYEFVNNDELQEHIDNDAVLIDVRMPDEYEQDHLDGAINVPYINFHWLLPSMEPFKNTEVILTCSTGKRAQQAYQILKYYDFDNVKVLKPENTDEVE